MSLRVVRGRVEPGRSSEFIDICRWQVAQGARTPGLLTFMGGYRRVEGIDEFVLASAWESQAAAELATGVDTNLRAAVNLRDVATIDSLDQYDLLPPLFRGILDAPGAVLRVTQARI